MLAANLLAVGAWLYLEHGEQAAAKHWEKAAASVSSSLGDYLHEIKYPRAGAVTPPEKYREFLAASVEYGRRLLNDAPRSVDREQLAESMRTAEKFLAENPR